MLRCLLLIAEFLITTNFKHFSQISSNFVIRTDDQYRAPPYTYRENCKTVARSTKINARRTWFFCSFAQTILAACQNHWDSSTCWNYNLRTKKKTVSCVLIFCVHRICCKILATNIVSRMSESVYGTQNFVYFWRRVYVSLVINLIFYYAVVYLNN